jgi:2-polyprenyl-3-methyl-5-hydroxy-6-metoxy-1,4-benzoquinol methylase
MSGLENSRFGAPGRYDIVACEVCGTEQAVSQPSSDEHTALYDAHNNFGGSRKDSWYSRLRQALFASPLYRLWLAVDGDISFHAVTAGVPGRRLLDVGCNEGRGLTLYRASGFEVEGLEPNSVAAGQACTRGFSVHCEILGNFRSATPFDVVVLSNVLEHALDPITMLDKAGRLLVVGGELWVSCPNSESWLRQISAATGSIGTCRITFSAN